jgi:hypothetical protein
MTEIPIGFIDIPMNSFFWMLRSWTNGTLVTIDGNARFSEMSFDARGRVRLRQLVNFPRQALDQRLIAYPEAGIIISKSARMFHIACTKTGRTKSLVPRLTGVHTEHDPILLDGGDGLIAFPYAARNRQRNHDFYIIYNFREDRIIKEIVSEENRAIIYPIDSVNLISVVTRSPLPADVHLFNWNTEKRADNGLTTKLSDISARGFWFARLINIFLEGSFLFTMLPHVVETKNQSAKVTWKEGFTDVNVVPLSYLIPSDMFLYDFFLSPDGKWATNFMGGFRGLRNELLEKRVFFHLDRRYPNGISMPVFADGYYSYHREQGAFVNHPVYGMCFAERIERIEDGRERRFLRLYNMDDALVEINRQLLETANSVIGK